MSTDFLKIKFCIYDDNKYHCKLHFYDRIFMDL